MEENYNNVGRSDPQPPNLGDSGGGSVGGSVLLVNDIAGYGKVGMAAMLPILSYLGIPAFCLPTALVSNTLNYGEFTQLDTTEYMRRTLPIWQHLGFHFDAICTGLMFSEEQAKLVARFCREQAQTGCTIFVDPVMGDNGSLYNGIGQRQVELMRQMVSVAHLTIPNYTEACCHHQLYH